MAADPGMWVAWWTIEGVATDSRPKVQAWVRRCSSEVYVWGVCNPPDDQSVRYRGLGRAATLDDAIGQATAKIEGA